MIDKSPFFEYWTAYGGWKALFTSKFFWISLILNLVMYHAWYPIESKWWDQVTSIIPSILGFTLGGFAMWVAIGDEKFKSLIAGNDEDEDGVSPFMEVNATFTHFVLLQILALIFAIIAANFDYVLISNKYLTIGAMAFSFTGYFLFLYALLTAIAAVFAILKVAKWYDDYQTEIKK